MTPASLKSARNALGQSMQGLAEDLGYSGKHAYKSIQRMENGRSSIPHRVPHGIRRLLKDKITECSRLLFDIYWPSEPTGATESEKPQMCDECGVNPPDLPSKLCPGCEAYREHQA